ncbi:hypothetical protein SAMD00019534_062800, partial [Acytostelium subglobosum LB1]|uniref:hypothetical protein n=1 Tax=Acytostelium subglobosum LB1 TaxID=1410327 RepID=UPI000644BC15
MNINDYKSWSKDELLQWFTEQTKEDVKVQAKILHQQDIKGADLPLTSANLKEVGFTLGQANAVLRVLEQLPLAQAPGAAGGGGGQTLLQDPRQWILDNGQQIAPYNDMDNVGRSFPFLGRETTLLKMKETITVHWSSDTSPESRVNHSINLSIGAPGIGKSRLLREFGQLLHPTMVAHFALSAKPYPSRHCSIVTSYGNGSPIQPIEQSMDLETCFAIRVLCSFFQVTFPSIISVWPKGTTLTLLTAFNIIEQTVAQGAGPLVIYLGIDEIQNLLVEGSDSRSSRHLITSLTNVIGGQLNTSPDRIFLVCCIAGTIYSPIEDVFAKSSYPSSIIPLPLLSLDHCKDIIKSTPQLKDLPVDNHDLDISIWRIGGWPRPFEFFVQRIIMMLSDQIPISLPDILHHTRDKLYDIYKFQSQETILQLMAYCIAGINFSSKEWSTIGPIPGTTFEHFEERGYITKVQVSGSKPPRYCPMMPLMFVDWSSNYTNSREFLSLKHLLDSITEDKNWMHWEGFCSHYTLVRSQMLTYIGSSQVSLDEWFGHPFCKNDHFASKSILITKGEYVELANRFPNATYHDTFDKHRCFEYPPSHSNVYLNAPGAPWDWFSFYASTTKGLVYLLYNGKHTIKRGTALNLQMIVEEHEKTSEVVKDNDTQFSEHRLVVTAIVTNCKRAPTITRDSLPPLTVLVDEANCESFFGPVFSYIISNF